MLPTGVHRQTRRREGQDRHLVLAGVDGPLFTLGQVENPQARVRPARRFRTERHGVRPGGQRPGAPVQVSHR